MLHNRVPNQEVEQDPDQSIFPIVVEAKDSKGQKEK